MRVSPVAGFREIDISHSPDCLSRNNLAQAPQSQKCSRRALGLPPEPRGESLSGKSKMKILPSRRYSSGFPQAGFAQWFTIDILQFGPVDRAARCNSDEFAALETDWRATDCC